MAVVKKLTHRHDVVTDERKGRYLEHSLRIFRNFNKQRPILKKNMKSKNFIIFIVINKLYKFKQKLFKE